MSSLVLVVDFDGTIYKGNSFPGWIIFCLRRSLVELRFRLLFRMALLLFLRKICRVISHEEFKHGINKISYPESWAYDFCCSLENGFDERVLRHISDFPLHPLVISTAAPWCYAKALVRCSRLKVISVISSAEVEGVFVNNYGPKKLEMTVDFLSRAGFSGMEIILFTDHHSDIHLARKSSITYLCNSDSKTLCLYKSNGVLVRVVGDVR